MNEPRYQWSKFAGPNRDEQYVVRADTFEDFKKQKEDIMTEFFSSSPATQKADQPQNTAEASQSSMGDGMSRDWCSIHDEQMYAKEGRHGTFYSHYRRTEDGKPFLIAGKYDNCSGRGYTSEQRPSA